MRFDHGEFGRLLCQINDASCIIELRSATMAALGMMEIGAAYFLAPIGADPRIGSAVYSSNLPDVWERHYRATLYQFDPLPQMALAQLRPFAWPAATDAAQLDTRQRRYLRIAARYGLGQGIGVACFGPNGRSGFLGAVLPQNRPPPKRADLLRVHAIGQLSFLRYCGLIRREGELPPLSNRELEVLQWVAQGKSNPVIAKILGISPSSVDIYVKRIFAKLEVTDRTSASVRAISLGLWVAPNQRPPDRFMEEGGED